MTAIAVMVGGALGSLVRYGLSIVMNPSASPGMPWGTLAANIMGCLLIGWLATALTDASEPVRIGVMVGVLGGFTTFSSFGLESIRLFQSGHTTTAIAYILLSNAGGLAAAWLGHRLTGQ